MYQAPTMCVCQVKYCIYINSSNLHKNPKDRDYHHSLLQMRKLRRHLVSGAHGHD